MNCILVQLLSIRPFDILCMSGREELGDGDTANSFPCACSVAVDVVCIFLFSFNSLHFRLVICEHDDIVDLVAQVFIASDLSRKRTLINALLGFHLTH